MLFMFASKVSNVFIYFIFQLPVQAIADVEKQVDFCPDVTKSSLTMLHQPAELGNAVIQSYFWRL